MVVGPVSVIPMLAVMPPSHGQDVYSTSHLIEGDGLTMSL